jgi:hypothetical protein
MIRERHNQCRNSKSMEDALRTYSHDDEFGFFYIGLGVDGIEPKEECINMVEIIKGL